MLAELLENKLPTKLLLIADTEDARGLDLFSLALKKHILENSERKVNLFCFENPPSCYLPQSWSAHENAVVHNYFADPLGWNGPSPPEADLSTLASEPSSLADGVVFLDSFSALVDLHGFQAAFRALSALRAAAGKTVCLVHRDVLEEEQVEGVRLLWTGFVGVGEGPRAGERVGEVVWRKAGGRVVTQREEFSVSEELQVESRSSEAMQKQSRGEKEDFEGLTTFRLGLRMSEKERKAKEELVLPYVKHEKGEIIYEAGAEDLEDDPDDDLDI